MFFQVAALVELVQYLNSKILSTIKKEIKTIKNYTRKKFGNLKKDNV